jgi:hypothetical protein
MIALNVKHEGETCALLIDGKPVIQGPWRAFLELGSAMTRVARGTSQREYAGEIQFERVSPKRISVAIGRWSTVVTVKEFARLAGAVTQIARQAESTNNLVLTQQVQDNALLARIGLPFGLSDNPRVKDETRKVAAHDRTLRQAIPFPALPKPIPGVPRLRHISTGETLRMMHEQNEQMKEDLYGKAG